METAFEQKHVAVGNTELWNILKQKAVEENLPTSFLDAVGKICEHGVTLSKDIIRFFPTFTLHDETHIANVCNWMIRLLGNQKGELSASEAALLVMSACCHDIGMSVSVDQEKALTSNTESIAWKEYFRNHLREDEEFSETKTISAKMLRNFIRTNHHKRISEQISTSSWPPELKEQGITRQIFVDLCQSHGESLEDLKVPKQNNYDLRLCAVLLRLSDILDFDSSRAPADLFKHLGLEHPENFEQAVSQTEWAKNRSGVFGEVSNDIIPFTASFTSLQLECEVQSYLEWVQQELDASNEYMSRFSGRWQTLALPRKISTDSIERMGYRLGKFHLTMDQDRVLELLTGRNLYSDPGVFVRELLQNAIDAIHTRSILDPSFQKKDGKITVRTWMDNEGYSWFRIEDNGTGMDENIIINYFLKVGRSYYSSDDFRADKRHYGRGSDYTPISRFGIGILSCFMSDPEHNLLEVSTKRYTLDPMEPNSAIRLNVTGLNGYYYLAREGEQDEHDEFFLHMHHPDNNDIGYRYEVGTTICVRLNLFQLSDYRSLKEIMDKYVQFPEFSVEYFGQEGHITYPTQDELMEAAHKLNPDGSEAAIKEYTHPISEKQFELLKQRMPDTKWLQKPSVVLKYYPLDWFADSENVKGVAIFVNISASAATAPIEYEGTQLNLEFKSEIKRTYPDRIDIGFSYVFPKTLNKKMDAIRAEINGYGKYRNSFEKEVWKKYPQLDHAKIEKLKQRYNVDEERIHEKYYELEQVRTKEEKNRELLSLCDRLNINHGTTISYEELSLSTEEAKIIQYVIGTFSGNKSKPFLTAYNGILSDSSNLLGTGRECIGHVLLLRDAYCPEVDLARDSIKRVPLETACDLCIIQHALMKSHPQQMDHKLLQINQLVTEQELQHILRAHPVWQKQLINIEELQQQIKPDSILHLKHFVNSLYDYLYLAVLKKHFTVYFDVSNKKAPYITQEPADNSTSFFPVTMFFKSKNENEPLGRFYPSQINYYNQDHPFSKWLIKNQEMLQKQVPSVYNNLLEIMVLSSKPSEIIEKVNSLLRMLRNFNNNLFEVSDTLFLNKGDFSQKK